MHRLSLGLALSAVLVSGARADLLPPLDIHAQYEEQLILQTLAEHWLERDPNPNGKIIEAIIVTPHDVFLPGFDPAPQIANMPHVTTKPYIIEQELLFHVGDTIGPDTLEETARTLRGFFTLAIARIVTAKGSAPGNVVVVVVAKDLWSLRLNSNFDFPNGKLNLLQFTPAEHNLLGRNKFLGMTLRWDPGTFRIGEQYTDPRLFRSRLVLDEQAQVIFNREIGGVEGVLESLSVSRPLYSLSTKWGWASSIGFQDDVARLYRNGDFLLARLPSGVITRYQYRRRLVNAGASVTRSFGAYWKQNLSLGYSIGSAKYRSTDPINAAEISGQILPFSEDTTALSLSYSFFEARFIELRDIQTFDVTEDYRLGPDMSASVTWANPYFGLPNDFVRLGASAGWSWRFGRSDLLGASVGGEARYWRPSVNPFPSAWVNRVITFSMSNITSPFAGIRLFTRGWLQLRDYDLSRATQLLGASSGLRGFPAGQFDGRHALITNIELRSRPIALWTVYLGLAAFYDGGSTWPSPTPQDAGYHQDVGAGVRIFLPQLNHQSLRVDVAFPILETTPGLPSVVPTVAFGQAF